MKRRDVLVIVAHPDDETIWMGGTLLKNKDRFNTTIISLCRKKDKDRAPKFKKVCKAYNAKCFMSDLDDSEEGDYKNISIDDVIKRIKKFVRGKSFDFIFTHGKNGEYGHIRHKQAHNAVVKMLEEKQISATIIYFFSYHLQGKFCRAKKNSDKFIKLKAVALLKKKSLIRNVYGFQRGSFEETSCREIESFNIKNQT